MSLSRLVVLIITLLGTVAAWIDIALIVTGKNDTVGVRMRRRIKRTLGKSVQTEAELTSLSTWMKVKKEEERGRGSQ
jgi:hypothetical protein